MKFQRKKLPNVQGFLLEFRFAESLNRISEGPRFDENHVSRSVLSEVVFNHFGNALDNWWLGNTVASCSHFANSCCTYSEKPRPKARDGNNVNILLFFDDDISISAPFSCIQ